MSRPEEVSPAVPDQYTTMTAQIAALAKQVELERGLPPMSLQHSVFLDHHQHRLVMQCLREIAYLQYPDKIEYPATWWQHFKQRFAPQWLLRRWPVKKLGFVARLYFEGLNIQEIGRKTYTIIGEWDL